MAAKARPAPERENFAHLVYRVYGALHSSVFRALAPEPELGRPGMDLLGFLHASGPSSVTEAAEACRMAKSQLSITAERLVEKGYLERERDDGDRRVARIRTTKRGEEALARAYAGVRERVDEFFSPLTTEERRLVREAFALVAGLDRAERPSPGGPT